jgi:hypothetical protein
VPYLGCDAEVDRRAAHRPAPEPPCDSCTHERPVRVQTVGARGRAASAALPTAAVTLLAREPILVVASASGADLVRHVQVRASLGDEIERGSPYRDLLGLWRDADIREIAERAHDAFDAYVRDSGQPAENIDFAFGGRLVGRVVRGHHVLDEPTPPPDQTLPVGAFVDRLLVGEATLGDLGELLTAAPAMAHVDLRSPRPAGTVERAVEIDWSTDGVRRRAPLETLLAELDAIWGRPSDRRGEALAFLASIRLDRWPSLASDVLRRYGANVLATIRGEQPRWEYRVGDPSAVGTEPPDLAIPAFEPSGDAATDRRRIALWQERVADVSRQIESAATARTPTHPPTRPFRDDERAAIRRNARWLYQQAADHRSLVAIATADLGSADRWRDVQRALRRARQLLDMGADPA